MIKIKYLSLLLACFGILPGCAGYVSGDFRNVTLVSPNYCYSMSTYPYKSRIVGELENDGGFGNPAGILSAITLGIIPTYWYEPISVKVPVYKNSELVREYEYSGGVHKVYGILWMLPYWITGNRPGENTLASDEGGGIRIESGIKIRAMSKAYADSTRDLGIRKEDLCFCGK